MSQTDQTTAGPSRAAVVFGSSVAQARSRLGWTQVALADLLGVHLNTVKLIELGKRGPGPDLLARLERLIAIGERAPGEDDPLYLLARGGAPDFYLDARHLPAVFLHRELAEAVADLLRLGGEPDAAVVSAWWSYARRLLTRPGRSSPPVVMSRVLDGPARDGSDREPRLIAARAARFVAETAEQPVEVPA